MYIDALFAYLFVYIACVLTMRAVGDVRTPKTGVMDVVSCCVGPLEKQSVFLITKIHLEP